MALLSNQLKKMTIQGYADPEFKEKKGDPYTVLVNPNKYSETLKIEYAEPPVIGGGTKLSYSFSPPSDLDFEFIFDATGIVTNGVEQNALGSFNTDLIWKTKGQTGIQSDVSKFVNTVHTYQGNEHRPNYLKIQWGDLTFNCVLLEVAIEYKLFSPEGAPLRAVAKAKFRKFKDEELITATEKRSSPDLTHVRVAEAGDTLPLMTKRIYGDSKYYLEVARANKLTSFRKLKTGQRIIFPPIQKPQ